MPKRALAIAEHGEPPRLTTLQITDQIFSLALLRQDAKNDQELAAIDQELSRLIEVDLTQKVDGIGQFCRRCDAEDSHLQQEQARIQKKRKKVQRAQENIRNMVGYVMAKLETDVLHGRVDSIYLNEGKESSKPDIYNPLSLPEKYLKQVVTYEPDEELIMRDLQAQVEVPGARLKEKGDAYITIR